jgi:hypothetical protein
MLPTKFHFICPSGFRGKACLKINQSLGLCLLTDQNEMNNLYREHSIDASYQVSVHLAELFLRKRFLEIDQSETIIACGGHVC